MALSVAAWSRVRTAAGACGLVGALSGAALPAAAQGPNTGALRLTAGIDVGNAYYFRGLPQDESGVVMWPYADLTFTLWSGTGVVRNGAVTVGTWNSLHTGDVGLDGPVGQLWYESRFYSGASVGFGGGATIGIAYTAYNSPNFGFAPVKELAFKVALDDGGWLGRAAVRPYVLVARELDGQADAGRKEGTYVEIGAAPGLSWPRVGVAVPLKVGLSAGDYYEGAFGDETFGFFSVAAVATVPLTGGATRFGTWNVRGGVEFLRLGRRNQALGETNVVGSIGIGFGY
jgi:hypothetical protein